jgi:hypothetical protein
MKFIVDDLKKRNEVRNTITNAASNSEDCNIFVRTLHCKVSENKKDIMNI